MAAHSMSAAIRTPLIAAFPKMLFPVLVILPGLLALAAGGGAGGIIPQRVDAATGQLTPDYNMAIPALLLHYFPPGLLGLGLTALLASFMSGMAGNVTAFNTVWTYDIYQTYIKPGASDRHYLTVGRLTTVFGIAFSIGAAYLTTRFNNVMDMLQLVFAFVNAPLFATFLLGMFWARATGHGAFWGLVAGTLGAALHHGITLPADAVVGIKGGWFGVQHTYASEMAQNFWTAIVAWTMCFAVTIGVSLVTAPRRAEELAGLVYSLTPKPRLEPLAWYARPSVLAGTALAATLVINVLLW
jgi:SSS family solute:Na+ symporter